VTAIIPDYVGLFAGAGGWDLAAERLGLQGIGVESNGAACATLRAAGFPVFQGSVTDPMIEGNPAISGAPGLIASPPCQTFSSAGNGKGRADMDKILEALRRWAWSPDDFSDPRTSLVLEPARWILGRLAAERPYRWIAMEQVPQCLPIFEAYATMLEDLGYFTAVGILWSEQFGVAQTRKRVILLAHRDRPVSLPEPTHSRYHNRDPKRLDEGVLPWVSMAQALGWTDDVEVHSNYNKGGIIGNKGVRTGDQPAAAVTSKVNRNKIYPRNGAQKNATVRDIDCPAPTLLSSADNGDTRWVFCSDNRPNSAVRELDQPAPTILGNGERGTHAAWKMAGAGATSVKTSGQRQRPTNEPASSITGGGSAAWVEDGSHKRRVSVIEAGVLQSFPSWHPWQGTRTEQYQQVGNAIPALLAEAVLRRVAL
jgi:DNA (cytosine-5)-methyltransferase 1